MNNEHEICTLCEIDNVTIIEDCGTCFGFGLKCSKHRKGYIPITESECIVWRGEHYLECPECGGIPTLF